MISGNLSIVAKALRREPEPVPANTWSWPEADDWPADDLVAVGADLSPSTIVDAYRRGLFPMHVHRRLGWWSPEPRGVLEPEAFHVSRSLRKSARRFEIRADTEFGAVMAACGDPRRPHGWINAEIVTAYTEMHRLGWAHSVEVFDRDETLVGGMYGLRIGGLFAGESMFHRATDASKVALWALAAVCPQVGIELIDVQWATPHLASLGVGEVSRRDYLARLAHLTA